MRVFKRSLITLSILGIYFLSVINATYSSDFKENSHSNLHIDQYNHFVNNLDNSQKESILHARDELHKRFSDAPGNSPERAFRIFQKFYYEVINTIDNNFRSNKIYATLLNAIYWLTLRESGVNNPLPFFEKLNSDEAMEIKKTYADTLKELYELRKCGISFNMSEGDWYLTRDVDFLVDASSFLNGELREYILFNAHETRKVMVHDMELLISWDELREKILRHEEFIKKHPSLLEAENAKRYCQLCCVNLI